MIGKIFGRLVVIAEGPLQKPYKRMWHCKCSCGNVVVVRGEGLRSGNTKSCGCWHRDAIIARTTTHGHARRGANRSRTYKIWQHILRRCLTKSTPAYKTYGGRGITVCRRWLSFHNFLDDMGECKPAYSIDRIDGTKGYSKENCRWATRTQQAINRRTTRFVTYDGETRCLKEWATILNLNYSTVLMRLKRGWSVEKTFRDRSHIPTDFPLPYVG